ncbi:hypothetical protein FB570_111239 [Streptomyces sp. T12]|uniref:hypothetical protein n=1 Tax=Streptomyces sp. T12 TaxID=477697 RepID=UPI0011A93D5D|nr:hypothetical protein [Streptomyces sp. T12]TWD17626.1 hypothetical protein FB570_111239 [Streptomyces sp. T12]
MDSLDQLFSLLNPENKSWLQSQAPERQRLLAARFVNAADTSGAAEPTGSITNKALDSNAATDKANTLIEEARAEGL